MEQFLITIIIPTLTAWGICTYLVFFTYPFSTRWVLIFLIALFLSLELSIGLGLYFINSRRDASFLDKRKVLQKNLVRAFPVALPLPLYLLCRYYNFESFLIFLAFLILASISEYKIHKNL